MERLPRPSEFPFPRQYRWSRLALAISVLLHALLLFGWIEGRIHLIPLSSRPQSQLIYLPQSRGSAAVPLPQYVPQRSRGVVASRRERPTRRPVAPGRAPTVQRADSAPVAVGRIMPPPVADTAPAAPAPELVGPSRLAGPGMARGKLWVHPLPLPPRELAARLTNKAKAELLDSAVKVTVQAFLDSIANEPGADRVALPSWTKEIGGKTFGIDSRNIYIAGLRIPAVVLGLLPISGGGNIEQNRAYSHIQGLRDDLIRAARRAETLDEFKKAVKELREQKERERQLKRNQRLPSDSVYREPSKP